MNFNLKPVTFLSFLTLLGCAHPGEIQYASFSELAVVIQDDVRGEKNIPHRGLMFLYKGPWGWSDPEYRLTVDMEIDFTAELLELKEHTITQADKMWDSGIRTHDGMKEGLKANSFRVNIKNCSVVFELTNDLWQSVVSYASSFNHEEVKRLIVDGGSSFNFYLSDGDYNVLMYRVVDHDHPLSVKALGFIEQLRTCNDVVNNKL